MKTAMVVGLCTLTLAALLAQASQPPTTYEGVVKEMLKQLQDVNKTLGTILDEQSAETARPEFRKSALKLQELRKLAETFQQPDKDEKDRLELLYRTKFDETLKKLQSETIRVKTIPGGVEALKEIAVATKKKKTP